MVNNDNGYIQMIFRQGVNVRIAERTMEMRVGLIWSYLTMFGKQSIQLRILGQEYYAVTAYSAAWNSWAWKKCRCIGVVAHFLGLAKHHHGKRETMRNHSGLPAACAGCMLIAISILLFVLCILLFAASIWYAGAGAW